MGNRPVLRSPRGLLQVAHDASRLKNVPAPCVVRALRSTALQHDVVTLVHVSTDDGLGWDDQVSLQTPHESADNAMLVLADDFAL